MLLFLPRHRMSVGGRGDGSLVSGVILAYSLSTYRLTLRVAVLAQLVTVLAPEHVEAEDRGFGVTSPDGDTVALIQADACRVVVGQEDGRPAQDLDLDQGAAVHDEMVERLRRVVESQSNADSEQAVRDAAVVARTAERRRHHQSVTDDLTLVQLPVQPQPKAHRTGDVLLVDQHVVDAGQAGAGRPFGLEPAEPRLAQSPGQ